MDQEVIIYQFLSRALMGYGGNLRPAQNNRSTIKFHLHFQVQLKPFDLSFAEFVPKYPSAGPFQFLDETTDNFFSQRWPWCISASGKVNVECSELSLNIIRDILIGARNVIWRNLSGVPNLEIPPDQKATVLGYRREFSHFQLLDREGNRRPSEKGSFAPTEIGELTGPGVVTLPQQKKWDLPNELVWSPILPFPNRTTIEHDKVQIEKAIFAQQKQYNSVDELFSAERLLNIGEIKSAVRALASALDAIIQYYGKQWSAELPRNNKIYAEKIEEFLKQAGKPSMRQAIPETFFPISNLYYARNTMHEGDCYFRDSNGTKVQVRRKDQVEPWLQAVKEFLRWIESLV